MHTANTAPETKSMVSDATGALTIPPNEHRVAILIGSPAGRTTLVSIGATGNPAAGVPIPPQAMPLLISAATVGNGVKAAITLVDSAGAPQTFSWTEWIVAK